MAQELTSEQKIAELEAKLKLAEQKDNGGKDVESLRKAEDSVNTFDLKIAQITLEALAIETTTEQREAVRDALINKRYADLVSKKASTSWV